METGETNLRWGRAVVSKLAKLGVRDAVVAPGSRSTPLAFAFAESRVIEAVPVLDERSAGFFALGLARATGVPVPVVCTSGSAVANLFPAVVEARMAGVPLILMTADRPPELQGCHAGQTIPQKKIFGAYARKFVQMELPTAGGIGVMEKLLGELFESSLCSTGPVHLNFPFREPLLPPPGKIPAVEEGKLKDDSYYVLAHQANEKVPLLKCEYSRVLIIAGAGGPGLLPGWGDVVLSLALEHGWPVLADPLSGLRNSLEAGRDLLVAHYDTILRDNTAAKVLRPEAVLQVGTLPTSKVLRRRLEEWDAPGWVVSPLGENFDPLHSSRKMLEIFPAAQKTCFSKAAKSAAGYAHAWGRANMAVEDHLEKSFETCGEWFEGKVAWLLNRHLPQDTAVHIASSMPIRDVESFWKKNLLRRELTANRGANGIDGTLSTAMGIAQVRGSAVLLTGDLAFLHDRNGLLLAGNPRFHGRLTVVLINNHGGGIFENLPIAGTNPPFEEFFATPQHIDFQRLSEAHGIPHHRPDSWDAFVELISRGAETPIRVIEIETDRKEDTAFRHKILKLPKT